MTIRDGRRCSGATAYLRPALKRPNLAIEVDALATKIVFEGTRAVGVEYVKGGRTIVARADREVILCGGVINSPQLLMLSGIGAADELKQHGIEAKVDLPGVGKNLQDHVSVILMYRRAERSPFLEMMRADRIGRRCRRLISLARGSPPTSRRGDRVPQTRPTRRCPTSRSCSPPPPLGRGPICRPSRRRSRTPLLCVSSCCTPRAAVRSLLGRPIRGRIPRIVQNFLATDVDRRRCGLASRLARDISAQPSMKPYIAAELAPGAAKATDAEVDAYVRATAITVHHPLGTCKMGAEQDAAAVVDLT